MACASYSGLCKIVDNTLDGVKWLLLFWTVYYFLIGIRSVSVGRIPPEGFLNMRCGCCLHWVEWVSALFMFYLRGFLGSHQLEKKNFVARLHSSELVNGDITEALPDFP
jgi:hypothetical protein